MENRTAKRNTNWGKISLICALATILLGFLSAGLGYFVKSKEAGAIVLVGAMLFLMTGVISGAIGLITKRAWIGLIINLLLLLFVVAVIILSIFIVCCPKPEF